MAEKFLEPQNPLKKIDETTGDVTYIYPLTTDKQIVMENGERLNTILNERILYMGETAEESVAEIINADTLGGKTEDMLVVADSVKLGGRPSGYYKAAYNLLDNSDFTNPINQRGQTSYTTMWGYTIDRWQLSDGNTILSCENSGVKLSSSANGYIFQRLPKMKAGKYTFAAKFYSNTGEISLTNKITDEGIIVPSSSSDSAGVLTLNFELTQSLDASNAFYRLNISNGEAIFEWAALYEGEYTAETLPAYIPKGYAHELLECQRYYYQLVGYWKWISAGICVSATECHIPIQFPTMMRTTPTVTIPNTSLIKIRCGAVAAQIPTEITWSRVQQDMMNMTATITGATNGNIAMLYFDNGGIIQFSADL